MGKRELYNETNYVYRKLVDEGKEELAKKYIDFMNKGVKKANELWEQMITHKFMGEFFDQLNKELGLNLTYSFEIKKTYNGKEYLTYESKTNMVEGNPILALAWEDFRVGSFNSGEPGITYPHKEGAVESYGSYEPEDYNYDKEPTVHLWLDIQYSYHHCGGGYNGAEIGDAFYENGKWKFSLKKDKRRDW